jgi:hypothetical protein
VTWFKVDDGFWSHPKTATLSDGAVTLWVRDGSYCCQHLTDGFVGHGSLRLLGELPAAQELVEAGLWKPTDGGWTFHDWHEYQETSDVVKKRRDQARERQRVSRERRSESRVTDSVTSTVTSQPPTRPDPTTVANATVLPPQAPTKRKSPRAAIADDFYPSQPSRDKIRAEFPGVTDEQLRYQHRKFCDHAIQNNRLCAGERGWNAAWCNWMRTAEERNELRRVNGRPLSTSDQRVAQTQALKLLPGRLELG